MGQMYEFYYTGGVLREAHVNTLKVLGYQIGNRVWDAPLPDSLIWTAAKRLTYRPEALDLPMLFVTGWWDHFPDEILTMFADVRSRAGAQARQDSRLIVGPWTHMGVDLLRQGGLEFPDAVDVEKAATMAFFDYWLRDQKANGRDRSPVVRYYQTADRQGGEGGRWVDAEAFPGEPVQDVRLFLHADGSISEQVAAAVDPQHPLTRSYRHDPRSPCLTLGGANLPPLPDGPTDHAALGQRSDLLVYSTGPLSSPLRVLGRMRATLAVALGRPDADLVVRVCDQYPGKGAYLVADGIQRTKLRQGVPARLVEPGTPVEVTVRLPVTAYTFAVGHELKLFIGSADYPRFERNPHTGADHWDADTAVDVQVTIHHSREHPTSLVLPLGMGISPTRAGPARQGLTPRADP
jgi:putative CocE/NonD family hydrolase